MEPPNALTELETQLLSASLRQRLFQRPAEAVRFGRYRLLERLGQGGMGVVFSAYDDELDRRVAIKLLHAGRGEPGLEQRVRLRREAQALGRLSHPNVVQVYEIGETQDQTFVAMEFVRGTTLQAWLSRQVRGTDEIVEVFSEAGRGVAAAHSAGLVHRDFKPENVLVGVDGRVRVVDFGLARGDSALSEQRSVDAKAELDAPLTATGALLGTPAYMAPEQVRPGALPIDARTDQFSFCVALYEALYGQRPFSGETLERYVAAVEAGELSTPNGPRAVPARLRQALLRGLRYWPDERWPDMGALLAAIDPRPVRARARMLLVATAVAFVALALGVGVWAAAREWQAHRREVAAHARLDAVEVQLASRLDAGEQDAAERLIADFVTAPEIRDTDAVAAVWLRWAAMLAERGASSQTAWARAYALAREPGARDASLLGLMRAMHAEHSSVGVRNTLALLAAEAPALLDTPELIERRFEVAAMDRDFAVALAFADGMDPDAAAAATVLSALSSMTRPEGSVFPELGAGGGRFSPIVRVVRSPLPVPDWRDGPPLALGWDGEWLALYRGGGDELVELQRWPTRGTLPAATAVDLDGDGAQEIYVGLGYRERGIRALRRDPSGQWRIDRPAPSTDAVNSDVDALVSGDLDGDGRPELIASVGVWRAYDIRVLRPNAAGELVVVARRKLGATSGLGVLRGAAPPDRIVTALYGYVASSTMFPDTGIGAPEGLYVLRLDGEALEVVRSVPTTAFMRRDRILNLYAGDLDGDGLSDVALGIDRMSKDPFDPRRSYLQLARQRPDGSFAMLQVGGLMLLGGGQLDDDAAAELVLASAEGETWLAGVGEQTIPPSVLPDPAVDGHAQRLEAAGAPAEVLALARAGLLELTLPAVESVGALAEASARRRMSFAATEVARGLGDVARLRDLLLNAADEPSLRGAALSGLVELHLQQRDLGEADAINARLLEEPSLAPTERARAVRLRDRLAALEASRRTLPLHFSRADSPPWSRLDPSVVRVDPIARAVHVHAFTDLETFAELPLQSSGERILLELDVSPVDFDWTSGLTIRLLDPNGATAGQLTLHNAGGQGFFTVHMTCRHPTVEIGTDWVGQFDREHSFRSVVLQLDLDVVGGELTCRVLDEQHHELSARRIPVPATPVAGRYRLALGTDPVVHHDVSARAHAVLSRIELSGAELAAASPPERREQAAALLVDGEPRAAEALLRDDPEPRARLWRSLALAELGRTDEAASGFASALREAPSLEPELRRWLRSTPQSLGPALRRGLGERRFLELLVGAWTVVSDTQYPPEALRVFRSGLAGVPETCHGAENCVEMRLVFGKTLAQLGDRARAQAVLSAALRAEPAPSRRQARELHLELAYLAAAVDDRADAWAHVEQALALAVAPDLVRDLVRVQPDMKALRGTPEWSAVLGIEDGPP